MEDLKKSSVSDVVKIHIEMDRFDITFAGLSQFWELGEAPYSRKVKGEELDMLGLPQEVVMALRRSIVATSELTRLLQQALKSNIKKIAIIICADHIALSIVLFKLNKKSISLVYKAPEDLLVVQIERAGSYELLPTEFEKYFEEICFGRYGLLQRMLKQMIWPNVSLDSKQYQKSHRESA